MHSRAQQAASARRPSGVKRWHFAAAALAVAGSAAAIAAPVVLFPDAPAPSTIAAYVDAARANLASNLNDREMRPFHLRLLRAECRAEGGVVLWFEQRMFPYLNVAYAYTLASDWPPQAWSGGANLKEPHDEEVAAFLGGRRSRAGDA